MVDSSEHADKREATPRGHLGRFARSATPRTLFDSAIRDMIADDRPATVVALFDDRASFHTIRDWRRGKLRPPIWAIELLRARLLAPLAKLEEIRR